jgi:hypothetical protein
MGRGIESAHYTESRGEESETICARAPHATTTELFDDAVVRDGLANHCCDAALGDAC